ncbi:lytic transglycosylase domain-containing protein [Alistipes sp.]|uniref:lytic transglycosylase domain-containing protein n=1 Tax=Alistipes sp. TaxID=1872444 RepID=UPI0025BDE01F|nr:lytic transglycosylase domain-containing protein [Alistipes sp.]
MRKLLPLLLLFAFGVPQAATLDKRPRKKRAKAQTAETAPAAAPAPAADAGATAPRPETAADAPRYNDRLAVDLSPVQIDSLLAVWRERQTLGAYEEFFSTYVGFDPAAAAAGDRTPDSVYVRRLRDLVSPVQLPYNYIVKGYIDRYTNVRSGTISRILGMSQYYFPLIEEELIKAGLPVELRALPIIESALSPTAVSPMGAAGLWQFMPATGKVYGLEVNSLVDERCDPVLSTRAACRYLKDLYTLYKDWTLAIAAYNCGPGNVNKALARAGDGSRTFWDIYDFLPRETRGYVPAFIGASYAYAYHKLHGIEFTEPPLPLATDTIRVDRLLHLGQVSSTIDIPMETLRQLNPQYKLDIVPATTKTYSLVLPQRYVCRYIQQQDSIFAKDSAYLKEYMNPANLEKKRQQRSGTIYTVKKGDTLGAIARKYRVTTAQLMRWNGIKNANKLRLGQKIRIEGR